MYNRILNILKSQSFLVFGPRGCGKTSYLRKLFPEESGHIWIDLLDDSLYQRLLVNSGEFKQLIPPSFDSKNLWIVCDEIQRLPTLLNYVHMMIESGKGYRFAITGSSARKLKRGGANLLAGRALWNTIHPLTSFELGNDFDLEHVLKWGQLPKIFFLATDIERKEFLKSYIMTYLRQEIKEEQIVRRLEPFVRFLEVAAQQNGKIINATKIGRHALCDATAVIRYFEILVDTLIGFYLEPYHKSARKVQTAKAKFYFFDIGVQRTLARQFGDILISDGYVLGNLFEHFVILECMRLNEYFRTDFRFYYVRTKDDVEIDLLIERSVTEIWAIEIKSSARVDETELKKQKKLADDLQAKRFIVASRETNLRTVDGIEIMPWQQVLKEIFPQMLASKIDV